MTTERVYENYKKVDEERLDEGAFGEKKRIKGG